MSVYTYKPGEVQLLVAGAKITGYADGTFIVASRDENSVNKVVGADGHVSRAINSNRGGSIRITLLQTGLGNDVLNKFAEYDENTGLGVFKVAVKSGETTIFAANGWVEKHPDYEFGKESGNREWTIGVDHLKPAVEPRQVITPITDNISSIVNS